MTHTTNEMPSYIYMPLKNGYADVFIYKYVGKDEDGYIYESNEFRTSRLTEEDIASNPLAYLNYVEDNVEELKKELASYDYIGVKIAMGVATKEDYADKIAYTEELRQKIRELED